ncbi:MAG: CPBP family intramembrane metalloprotease [Clostridia bacterium]|nr:CPBP family intramembrane metalloprotease [Clostridia bacterium]
MQNKKIFIINLIYYLCMLSVALIFVLGYFDIITNSYLSTFLIQGIVMFAIPILLYSRFVTKNIKQTFSDFGFKKISLVVLLCSIGLGFVLFFINNYVADIFYTILSILGYDNSINVNLNVNSHIGIEFLLTAIAPGICEEVLHRGMFMRGCQKQGYTRYGLLFSSLLFGLMHLNVQQFFYAMILGGLMGIVVIISDSIYPAMIIHFMNNALSIYFSYGIKYNWPFADFKYNIETMIFSTNILLSIAIICGLIMLLLALYKILIQTIARDKHKRTALQLAKDLKMEEMNYIEMQNKLDEIEVVLEQTSPKSTLNLTNSNPPLMFVDKIFLYSSIVLGALITICSFIWGIL